MEEIPEELCLEIVLIDLVERRIGLRQIGRERKVYHDMRENMFIEDRP